MASDLTLSERTRFRVATAADADSVAELHAESWRRHYRGAYADAFLDGDVRADRLRVWRERLCDHDPDRYTLLAERDGLIGFANTYLGADRAWGALLDNLHVAAPYQRSGVGSCLLALTAEVVVARAAAHPSRLHLWVLEQNHAAQRFYEALGATRAGRERVTPPSGVSGRLVGEPFKLRYAWADAAALRPRSERIVT